MGRGVFAVLAALNPLRSKLAAHYTGTPVKLGSTFIGLTTRSIYGPPGSSSSGSSVRPAQIAMDCGNGKFKSYRNAGPAPTATPPPAAMLPLAMSYRTTMRASHA